MARPTNWTWDGETIPGALRYIRVRARYGFDKTSAQLLDGDNKVLSLEVHAPPDRNNYAIVAGDELVYDTLEIMGMQPHVIDTI